MNIFVDTLPSGAALGPSDRVVSLSGQFQLILQGDGNLVLSNGQSPLWSSLTGGKPVSQCMMQPDGNLVIYDPTTTPLRGQLSPARRHATVAELIAAVVYCPV